MRFILNLTLALAIAFSSGCGGGGGGSSAASSANAVATPEPAQTPTSEPVVAPVREDGDITIGGKVTFDLVPHDSYGRLEYDLATPEPARGITVQLMDADNRVLRQTQTDGDGNYTIGAPPNALARVVAVAEYFSDAGPQWDFVVVDNTADGAVYLLADELTMTSGADEQRDIHAESGWNSMAGEFDNVANRPAAPFAILHAAQQMITMLSDADDSFVLPSCTLNWSYKNKAAEGDVTEGYVGTSHYDLYTKSVYILGDAYNDTDEYDFSVIQHELGHFFEDSLSRTDNIGGSHGLSSRLDMRVAFSEGFANAFTALISGQPDYIDSAGTTQRDSFRFSLEDNRFANPGWFNENSIGKLLYDLADSDNEVGDGLSLGFPAIYRVMTDDQFIFSDAMGSIFLFNEVFNTQQTTSISDTFSLMLATEDIYGTDRFGANETNAPSGNAGSLLPVYKTMTQGETIEVCSTNEYGEFNGLGVYSFVRLNVTSSGTVQFDIQRIGGGIEMANPNAYIYKNRGFEAQLISGFSNAEQGAALLAIGEYVLIIFDQYNADDDSAARNRTCFSVSAT